MNVRLAHKLGSSAPRKSLMSIVIDEAGYLILTIIALVASAVATEWTEQFLTVAIILGWKWICGNAVQVIQIYNHDQKEYQ